MSATTNELQRRIPPWAAASALALLWPPLAASATALLELAFLGGWGELLFHAAMWLAAVAGAAAGGLILNGSAEKRAAVALAGGLYAGWSFKYYWVAVIAAVVLTA